MKLESLTNKFTWRKFGYAVHSDETNLQVLKRFCRIILNRYFGAKFCYYCGTPLVFRFKYRVNVIEDSDDYLGNPAFLCKKCSSRLL